MMHLSWRTATASIPEGNCVEAAPLPDGGWAVRNTRDRSGAMLTFTEPEWAAFKDGVRKGEFD